ncbi:phytoene desaturase family protein [Candidatus Latescibacterota bacterium]
MKKHVIVVGAGPGGLTSAMILAHRGFDVTIFEKAPVVGGRNAPLTIGDFTFDTGPTFLMMSYILKEMFEETGRNIEDYLKFTSLDPLYRLKFEDFEFSPSPDADKTREQIFRLFPGNEAGFSKFLKRERARYEHLFPCLQKDYHSYKAYLDPIFIKALPHLGLGKSIFDNLASYFTPDDLKICFTFQSKYLGMSPWDCPALFTMLPFIEYEYGIYHVEGGLNAISLAMAKVVKEEGGKINTNTAVKRIIVENRKACGVKLENGEKITCDDVFINADFGYAASELFEPGLMKKYTDNKLKNMRFSCSTFMLYLAVDRKYDNLPHHSILFAQDYKKNVEQITKTLALPEDPSIYIQNASVTDSTLAPEGHSTIYILVPMMNTTSAEPWEDIVSSYREKVIDLADKRGGFTGLADHIVGEKIITPRNWESDYNIFNGATFNLAHNFSQLLSLRPKNRFEEFAHCYLVGGGTHPGSGLPTIYESGRISSNSMCDYYGIPYKTPSKLELKERTLNR